MSRENLSVGAMRRAWLRGLAIVAAIIVVVLVATGCSSNAGAPKPSVTHANGTVTHANGTGAEVASLLAEYRSGEHSGRPNGPGDA